MKSLFVAHFKYFFKMRDTLFGYSNTVKKNLDFPHKFYGIKKTFLPLTYEPF